MSIPGAASPLFLATTGEAAAFEISRSLRFNSADSAYLNRTPSSASNRKTFTFSAWIKKVKNDSGNNFYRIFGQSESCHLYFYQDRFIFDIADTGNSIGSRQTSAVFRDNSAWLNVVAVCNTPASTAGERMRLYVNGVEITAFNASSNPSQNADTSMNTTNIHTIGYRTSAQGSAGGALDAYLVEINFCDGTAYDASSFGEFDTNGVWQAKDTAGLSFGTNGFRLKFADNSGATATTLGKDTSGNSNNWTPNNLSVTAGVGNYSLVDTPTNGTASSGGDAGGVTVGNYCNWNPLFNSTGTYTEGNLQLLTTAGSRHYQATLGLTSGKWYWEIEPDAGGSVGMIGIALGSKSNTANLNGDSAMSYYGVTGYKQGGNTSGVDAAYGATFTYGDIIGVALDLDSGTKTLTFYKNGVSQGVAFNPDVSLGAWFPAVSAGSSVNTTTFIANFGQRAFAYTAPTGFKSLNTANLPTPTIADGSQYFEAKTYNGNSGTAQTISGLNFSPDFIWYKHRSAASSHGLHDIVRGAGKYLSSNSTGAELSLSTVTAFNSDGFSLGTDGGANGSGTFVTWTWDGGTSTVTNNDGSIASQVRANPSAGFSIVGWSGQSGTNTVGHGLNAAPELIILKGRTNAGAWVVGSDYIGWGNRLELNTTAAASSASADFNSTAPTSSVFTAGSNQSSGNKIAYCFAPVAGYSAMGSYTGNGSADGPFVALSFKPAFLLVKAFTSGSAEHWYILDSVRNTSNVVDKTLFPSLSNAEDTDSANNFDFLSNGFKLRNTNVGFNYSGRDYLYYAVAENPFQANGGLAR